MPDPSLPATDPPKRRRRRRSKLPATRAVYRQEVDVLALQRLVRKLGIAAVARTIGIGRDTLRNIIQKGYTPRSKTTAERINAAIRVRGPIVGAAVLAITHGLLLRRTGVLVVDSSLPGLDTPVKVIRWPQVDRKVVMRYDVADRTLTVSRSIVWFMFYNRASAGDSKPAEAIKSLADANLLTILPAQIDLCQGAGMPPQLARSLLIDLTEPKKDEKTPADQYEHWALLRSHFP